MMGCCHDDDDDGGMEMVKRCDDEDAKCGAADDVHHLYEYVV